MKKIVKEDPVAMEEGGMRRCGIMRCGGSGFDVLHRIVMFAYFGTMRCDAVGV